MGAILLMLNNRRFCRLPLCFALLTSIRAAIGCRVALIRLTTRASSRLCSVSSAFRLNRPSRGYGLLALIGGGLSV
jgi:hypothetical protein